jgi:methylated-DNA-[protein]-cysteine S-methyltransferase
MNFDERCYEILVKVPKGKVTTYKDIANALNSKAYRAVGNAMNKNKNAPKVPCHRVVNSNGGIGGYAYGVDKKIRILKEEGVKIIDGKIDLDKYGFKF